MVDHTLGLTYTLSHPSFDPIEKLPLVRIWTLWSMTQAQAILINHCLHSLKTVLPPRMDEPESSMVLFSWNKWEKLSAFLSVSLRFSFCLGSGLPVAIFLPINIETVRIKKESCPKWRATEIGRIREGERALERESLTHDLVGDGGSCRTWIP